MLTKSVAVCYVSGARRLPQVDYTTLQTMITRLPNSGTPVTIYANTIASMQDSPVVKLHRHRLISRHKSNGYINLQWWNSSTSGTVYSAHTPSLSCRQMLNLADPSHRPATFRQQQSTICGSSPINHRLICASYTPFERLAHVNI